MKHAILSQTENHPPDLAGGCDGGACAHVDQEEATRLAAALRLDPGDTVADIGAGEGGFSLALSKLVGAKGHVYATEVDDDRLAALRRVAADMEHQNLTVVVVEDARTGLADRGCDAIYLRQVYHHLPPPRETLASIYAALRPGGWFVVVDFEPTLLLAFSPPRGIPEDRGGHGVPRGLVADEAREAGFLVVEKIDDWPGPLLLDSYAVVLRKPAA